MLLLSSSLNVQPGIIQHNECVNKSCIKLFGGAGVSKPTHRQSKKYKESSLYKVYRKFTVL